MLPRVFLRVVLFPLWMLVGLSPFVSLAQAKTYPLSIQEVQISIGGETFKKLGVNNSIPGPVLQFEEGEEVSIPVTNALSETTAIHWHGLLLPGEMDGVPGFNGFHGIAPGETFTYHFRIRQSGTYWYHAHAAGQEQDGVYGAIVITPKVPAELKADRDYVLLLSEFSRESSQQILRNLKTRSDYYNYAQRTLSDFIGDLSIRGVKETLKDRLAWGEMRMSPTDLADVGGYTFLVNGQPAEHPFNALFSAGETVRLRIINASAMSIYDVSVPGLALQVISADGVDVQTVSVDEFRIGPAETYDVLIRPAKESYLFLAEPIDRSGFAAAAISSKKLEQVALPEHRKRALLTMSDMGMSGMDMSGMQHSGHVRCMGDMGEKAGKQGWADADTPQGNRVLEYSQLRALRADAEPLIPERDYEIRLGGNMERYIWTLNGFKFSEAPEIQLKYGEVVRLRFVNETMMAHPVHLHGMFMRLESSQKNTKNKKDEKADYGKSLAYKHTIIVPPGKTLTALLRADEKGEWPIHCHLLYHMLSGMMAKVIVR